MNFLLWDIADLQWDILLSAHLDDGVAGDAG